MNSLIKQFSAFIHYDECLHGCNVGWQRAFNECKCPIGKPYIETKDWMEHHFTEVGLPFSFDGMPRDKALELLNKWNSHGAAETIKGTTHSTAKLVDGKMEFEKVTTQRPMRWVYFLETKVEDN